MPLPFNQVVVQGPPQLADVSQKISLEDSGTVELAGEFSSVLDEIAEELAVEVSLESSIVELLDESLAFGELNPNIQLNTLEIQSPSLDFMGGIQGFEIHDTAAIESLESVVESIAVPDLALHASQHEAHLSSKVEIVSSTTGVTADAVAQQAIRAIQTEFVSFQQTPSQSITIEINPPELGRIQIQVEVASDQLAAQIVATEAVSAELLHRQKDLLLEALVEFGFGETSVDISHGSFDGDSEFGDTDSEAGGHSNVSVNFESESVEIKDGVVIVGLNLVA